MTDILPTDENNSPTLVAWRLGRVEKAVDENHRQVIGKLEEVLRLHGEVQQTKYRVTQVENTLKTMRNFLAGVSITLIGVIADLVVRHL
ncbi:MAG TPA: hypothetical protein V6C65_02320 [Allocoleopsis sp.]|jgi:hypothetical protein